MGKTVTFKDNGGDVYLDATGIYDTTLNLSQRNINKLIVCIDESVNGQADISVPTSWAGYLVMSSYSGRMGIWIVTPNNNLVVPVVDNAKVTFSCTAGHIIINCQRTNVTILRLGSS